MRRLFCLILMGSLIAQDLHVGKSQQPEIKKPFNLSYYDVKHLDTTSFIGNVLVQFKVNTEGKVIEPEIIDSFNTILNEAIIDRVLAIQFEPALQNGKPVEVQYMLPILFK